MVRGGGLLWLTVALVIQSLGTQIRAADPLVPALVIIGDSTVDVGNNNYLLTVVKSNFPPYGRDFIDGAATGRFCNGKIITDFVADFLGLPFPLAYLDPKATGSAILTGINTASSASGFYDNTAQNFNVISLTKQIEWLKDWQKKVADQVGQSRADTITRESIYVISTGSNDYVNNYYLNVDLQTKYNEAQYQELLIGFVLENVKDLHDLGARRIAIVGLPPLGCLPSQITLRNPGSKQCIDSLNQVAKNFNSALAQRLGVVEASGELSDAKVVLLDSYSYLLEWAQNPAKHGIKETSVGCCGTGVLEVAILCNEASIGTCTNADDHLFWDSFHPSQKFNENIARFFFDEARGPLGV